MNTPREHRQDSATLRPASHNPGRSGTAPSDFFRPYGRLPARRRWLIVMLAIATASTIFLSIVGPPGGSKAKPPAPAADVAACRTGQTADCVGSTTRVLPSSPEVPIPRSSATGQGKAQP